MDDSKPQIRNIKSDGETEVTLPIGYVYVKPRQGQSVLPCVPVRFDISDFGFEICYRSFSKFFGSHGKTSSLEKNGSTFVWKFIGTCPL